MTVQVSKKRLEMRIEARLKKIHVIGAMVSGSLGMIKRKCGNPNCKCATGEKHPAWLLTWKENKKTKSVYVPVDMVKEVQNWVKEYRRLQKLVQEITEFNHQIIKLHVQTKRAKGKNHRLRQKI